MAQPGHRSHLAAAGARQAGVALAIVVWFIAGMSLLVAGIVAQARVDTHMAQIHLSRASAVAAGDGAIRLMMVDEMLANDPAVASDQAPGGRYRVGEIDVTVRLVSAAGLIDLNKASIEMLTSLFQIAGGLSGEDARLLGETVVQSRAARAARRDGEGLSRLVAPEDLMRLPGANRTLLDSVRDFIVVGESGRGAVDWSLAPQALLDVLPATDREQAASVRELRGNRGGASRGERGQMAGVYRADAIVRLGDKFWLRRRWISIEPTSSSTLPWRVIRTEPPRVVTRGSYLLDGAFDA